MTELQMVKRYTDSYGGIHYLGLDGKYYSQGLAKINGKTTKVIREMSRQTMVENGLIESPSGAVASILRVDAK